MTHRSMRGAIAAATSTSGSATTRGTVIRLSGGPDARPYVVYLIDRQRHGLLIVKIAAIGHPVHQR